MHIFPDIFSSVIFANKEPTSFPDLISKSAFTPLIFTWHSSPIIKFPIIPPVGPPNDLLFLHFPPKSELSIKHVPCGEISRIPANTPRYESQSAFVICAFSIVKLYIDNFFILILPNKPQ